MRASGAARVSRAGQLVRRPGRRWRATRKSTKSLTSARSASDSPARRVSADPPSPSRPSSAANLKGSIPQRASNCRSFDTVFVSEGIRVIRTPIRAPNANAFAERWIETLRAECLDWLLILGPRHLDRILRIYVRHDNRRRPHRGLKLQVPERLAPVEEADRVPDIERRDLLGGLVHEYRRAA